MNFKFLLKFFLLTLFVFQVQTQAATYTDHDFHKSKHSFDTLHIGDPLKCAAGVGICAQATWTDPADIDLHGRVPDGAGAYVGSDFDPRGGGDKGAQFIDVPDQHIGWKQRTVTYNNGQSKGSLTIDNFDGIHNSPDGLSNIEAIELTNPKTGEYRFGVHNYNNPASAGSSANVTVNIATDGTGFITSHGDPKASHYQEEVFLGAESDKSDEYIVNYVSNDGREGHAIGTSARGLEFVPVGAQLIGDHKNVLAPTIPPVQTPQVATLKPEVNKFAALSPNGVIAEKTGFYDPSKNLFIIPDIPQQGIGINSQDPALNITATGYGKVGIGVDKGTPYKFNNPLENYVKKQEDLAQQSNNTFTFPDGWVVTSPKNNNDALNKARFISANSIASFGRNPWGNPNKGIPPTKKWKAFQDFSPQLAYETQLEYIYQDQSFITKASSTEDEFKRSSYCAFAGYQKCKEQYPNDANRQFAISNKIFFENKSVGRVVLEETIKGNLGDVHKQAVVNAIEPVADAYVKGLEDNINDAIKRQESVDQSGLLVGSVKQGGNIFTNGVKFSIQPIFSATGEAISPITDPIGNAIHDTYAEKISEKTQKSISDKLTALSETNAEIKSEYPITHGTVTAIPEAFAPYAGRIKTFFTGGKKTTGSGSSLDNGNSGSANITESTNNAAHSNINAILLKNQLSAQEIASGHAFDKHILQRGEFAGFIKTRKQFADHIENILNNPTAIKQLSNGRSAYWDEATKTVIIKNPKAIDGGTAFQPENGRAYFDNLR